MKIENTISPVFREKLRLLIGQTAIGITATLLTSFPLVLLLWNVSDHSYLLKWIAAVVSLSCLRYAHLYYFKRLSNNIRHYKIWRQLFYISFALSGLLWGLSVVFLAPIENIAYLGANVLWVFAIIASAIGSYSFVNRVFILFSVSASLTMATYLVTVGTNVHLSIAAGICIACGYMILSSRSLNKIIDKNIRSTIDEINKSKKIGIQRNTLHSIGIQKNILHSIAEAAEFLLENSWESSTPDFLQKLGTSVNVSRIQIFENTFDESLKRNTPNSRFHWYSNSAPAYEHEKQSISYHTLNLKRWESILSSRESIYGNINTFPDDEKKFLQSIDIKSLFMIPIFVGDKWWGYISFDECNNDRKWDEVEIEALKTAAAVIGAAIKRTWAEDKLSYNASHDSLTKLHNRRAFEVELKRLIKSCEQDRSAHVLCYIDLDRFKIINDTCGHNAGDQLLCQISEVMKTSIRRIDFLARIGGDEFSILLKDISLDDATRAIQELQYSIDRFSFHYEGNVFKIGASIGVVPINFKCTNPDKVLQAADNACRAVKQSNTSQVRVFDIDDTETTSEKHTSHSYIHINKALENDEFILFFQPISRTIDVNKKWEHFEVLIRMNSDNETMMTPNRFLPTAERYNLMSKIDRWVFKACIKKLDANSALYNHVNMLSINISGVTLCEPSFREYVTSILSQYNVPAEKICFEITETAAVSNLMEANNFITCLRSLGCKFALDDFGTGFSSFDILKNLAVDYVKIDGSFIKEINTNPVDYEMVRSLHTISKLMGIETIAEFVENQQILDTLTEIGITYVQGYAISKPMNLHDLLDPNHRNIDLQKKVIG